MRFIFSCISISTALILANVTSFAAASTQNKVLGGKIIYGLANVKYVKELPHRVFYIQEGAFKSIKSAEDYKLNLIKKYHKPVIVKKRGNYHVVLIGPIRSAAEVRALNNSGDTVVFAKQKVTKSIVQQEHQIKPPLEADNKVITSSTVPVPQETAKSIVQQEHQIIPQLEADDKVVTSSIVPVPQEIARSILKQTDQIKPPLEVGDKVAINSPVKESNHFEAVGALGIANLTVVI